MSDHSTPLGSPIPDFHPKHDGQMQGNEQALVITTIRATDLAFGMKRIPVGFYTVVLHSGGLEWKTLNKPVSVNNDVIEWGGLIPIPSDLSATVRLEVYASFEFQPMLGQGEALRELTVTVQQLLDRNEEGIPFAFPPIDGDVISPCSSLLVTVRRRRRASGTSSASRVPDPHRSITEPLGQLQEATNHGHGAFSRYRKHREFLDLESSIQLFKRALNNCPLGNPYRAAAQSNLAMAIFTRCQVDDSDLTLDVSIALYHSALAARPTGHPDRPSTLIQLAAVHFARFERRRDVVDSTQAEELLREAMDLSSAESHERQAAISALQLHSGRTVDPVQGGGPSSMERGSTSGLIDGDLLRRFEQFGDLADLQQAISVLEASISVQDHQNPALLGNLGMALLYRFSHLGQLEDLEQAIQRQGNAVDLTPDDHPDKPGQLNSLGNSLLGRFEHLGNLVDLEQAISRYMDAIDLTPGGHPDKPCHLNNLATSLLTRFMHLDEPRDLEEAISVHTEAVELAPVGQSIKSKYLNDLANCFRTRFECLGKLNDLEQAIAGHRKAMELAGPNRNNYVYLHSLSTSFLARFKHLGKSSDLDEAIAGYNEAIELTPDGNRNKPGFLNDLAMSFLTRFEWLGKLDDLEQAISGLREAVELAPAGYPDKSGYLSNLAICLRTCFMHIGQLNDLEEALSRHREAVQLAPGSHAKKPNCRKMSVITRSGQHSSEQSDLEQAISSYREAIRLTLDRHPDKCSRLNNLASCLLVRFEHVGELSDLEEATLIHGKAVELKNASTSTQTRTPIASRSSNPRNHRPCTRPHTRQLSGQMDEDIKENDHSNAEE